MAYPLAGDDGPREVVVQVPQTQQGTHVLYDMCVPSASKKEGPTNFMPRKVDVGGSASARILPPLSPQP